MPEKKIPLTFKEFYEKYGMEYTCDEIKKIQNAGYPSQLFLAEFYENRDEKLFKLVKSRKCRF